MKVVKRFFSSSLFRLYLILLLAILSEAGFYIYALNTNLTPYTIVSIGLTIALVVGGISLFLFYIPISNILKALKNQELENGKRMIKTGMSDVDYMCKCISRLSNSTEDVTAKLAAILDLSGRNMALFEIRESIEKVYITQRLFSILDEADPALHKTGLIPMDVFKEKLAKFENYIVPEYSTKISTMFQFETRQGTSRWIRLTTLAGDQSTLGLFEDVSDEMLKKTKLEYERDHDMLTSLYNRRAFIRQVSALFAYPDKLKSAAMVSIDLDKLKIINDKYGHEYGDKYIRKFGNLLNATLPKNSLIARFGGDEFIFFLYGFESQEALKHEIIKLNIAISNTYLKMIDSTEVALSASGGIAYYPSHSLSPDLLMKYADFAMYTVKRGTRGAFAEFNMDDFEKNSEVFDNSELINEFIQRKLYEFTFSPIIDAKTGALFGYKKILKSSHPQITSEKVLLDLAKTDEEKQKLEKFLIEESLKAFSTLPNKDTVKVFINTVPSQALLEDDYTEISNKYADLLRHSVVQLRASLGPSEITEIKLKRIKLFGGALCLSGYGVEQYDNEFLDSAEPRFLKLDLSLTQSLIRDFSASKLIESLISSAHQKNICVVAEGVPTQEIAFSLADLGVDFIEGPFITKPSMQPPVSFPIIEAKFKNRIQNRTSANSASAQIRYVHRNRTSDMLDTLKNQTPYSALRNLIYQ